MARTTMTDFKDLSLEEVATSAAARGISTAGKDRIALAQEIVAHDHFAAAPVAGVTVHGERIASNGQAHKLDVAEAAYAMEKALRW